MDLRALRQEIQDLPALDKNIHLFLNHWATPLRSKSRLPSLQKISAVQRKDLHNSLTEAQELALVVKLGQQLQEKCHSYIYHLIELKLTLFNGNKQKSKMILNKFLQDEIFNFKQTLLEQTQLEQTVAELQKQYSLINEHMEKVLSLEDSLTFQEIPHAAQLKIISKTVQQQKDLLKELGKQFIVLARETGKKK